MTSYLETYTRLHYLVAMITSDAYHSSFPDDKAYRKALETVTEDIIKKLNIEAPVPRTINIRFNIGWCALAVTVVGKLLGFW